MAKFFGGTSRHLLKNDWKYYFLSGLVMVGFWVFFYFVVRHYLSPNNVLQLSLLLALVFAFGAKPVADGFRAVSDKYARGRRGEAKVAAELKRLPEEFSVFADVRLPRGNLDFAVVGPTGIFAVEVKSLGGDISYDGQQLVINGKTHTKNYLHQAFGEARALRRLLSERVGDLLVVPVLVFAGSGRVLGNGSAVERVYVMHGSDIVRFLEYRPPYYFTAASRPTIEEQLRRLIG